MNIDEFRAKYPQYDNVPDGDLANKFYTKYYSTKMPRGDFMQKFLGERASASQGQTSIAYAGIGSGKGARLRQAPPQWKEYISQGAHTILPVAGAAGGFLVGAGAGGIGAPVGGTLGYAGAKSAARSIDEMLGLRVPSSLKEAATRTITEDIPEGMLAESVGPAARMVGRGLVKATGGAGKYTGGLITGKGTEVIAEAYKAGEAGGKPQEVFLKALREKGSGKETVKTFRNALQTIKDKSVADYGARLAEIERRSGGKRLNIKSINNTIDSIRKTFRIDRIRKTKSGYNIEGLTTLNPADKKEFEQILQMLDDWKTHPKGNTILGLDSLKQQLDNFYTPNSKIGLIATRLKNTVRSTLNENVPGYREMTKRSSKIYALVKEVNHALSLNTKAAADTVLRKIFTGIKEDKEFRRELMAELQQLSGNQLLPQAAGATMNAWLPEGLIGRGLGAAELISLGGGLKTGDYTIPAFNAALLGISSPRIAGEIARGAGATSRIAKQAIPYNKEVFDLGALIATIMEMNKRERLNKQYPLTMGEPQLD